MKGEVLTRFLYNTNSFKVENLVSKRYFHDFRKNSS